MADSFTQQPFEPFNTVTGDNASYATRPGKIAMSQERLRRQHPDLWEVRPWMVWRRAEERQNRYFITHVAEHLRYGLAEAALVTSLQPLLVACYSAELDAVLFIGFWDGIAPQKPAKFYPPDLAGELVRRHDLRVGSQLVAVNMFSHLTADKGYPIDLRPGPQARGVWGNFTPFIAEFLTSDLREVEARRREIEADEWARCRELAGQYLASVVDGRVKARDGRPLYCWEGKAQNWRQGQQPPAA